MKQFLNQINSLILRLIPKLEVSGLEISDGLVRFYSVGRGENKTKHVLLRLEPGVVTNGKVINAQALQETLVQLHKRVSDNPKKVVSVVASIPINNIYIQPFSLPSLARDNLKESAELNLRMISPIDVSKAYYDWQEIGENIPKDQLDIVGAFIAKDVADKFIEVIQGANFSVAAVEFSSLSLIRAALKNGITNKDVPSLILQMDQGGLGFIISHMGQLYFHYFTEWDRYRDGNKNIDIAKFKDGVVDEVRKLINFYLTNFKTNDIKDIAVLAENFTEEVRAALQEALPGIQVQTVNFNEVNSAYGSALRGAVVGSRDSSISLANLSAIDVFRKSQITNLIAIWRNFMFTTFGFLLLVFLGSAIFFQNIAEGVKANDPLVINQESTLKLIRLENEVNDFNTTVAILMALTGEINDTYPIASKLTGLMAGTVNLRRMTINNINGTINIIALASREELARDFKAKLEADSSFIEVDLPFQEFRAQANGTVEFLVKMKLANANIQEEVL